MLRDATQTALFEYLEVNKIPYTQNKSESVVRITDCESKILLRSMDEYERLRGTNLAWFGLDELTYMDEGAWLRLEGRLRDPKADRLAGIAVWTPKGFDWVYRKFVAGNAKQYHVTLAKPFENHYILDAVPDFYDRLRTSYDEAFYQQEVLGQYLNVGGSRVFAPFDRGTHVTSLELDPDLPLLWAMDFNVDPMSSVVAQMRRNEFYILDEIVLNRASTQDACDEFSRRYGGHKSLVVIYGDASGRSMSTKGSTDYDIVRDHFLKRRERMEQRIQTHNPAVRDRITATNARLKNAEGETAMWIDPRCRELIADFEEVSYKAESTEVDKTKDRRRTHLSDALGYLICQESRVLPKFGEQSRPFRL